MTQLTVALIVTDARKSAVEAAIAALTPDYTVGFLRPCCALTEPAPTWETPPTHWYANATAVDAAIVSDWQDAVDAAGLGDALNGLVLFTAQNAVDAVGWAQSNLASEGLRFAPDEG